MLPLDQCTLNIISMSSKPKSPDVNKLIGECKFPLFSEIDLLKISKRIKNGENLQDVFRDATLDLSKKGINNEVVNKMATSDISFSSAYFLHQALNMIIYKDSYDERHKVNTIKYLVNIITNSSDNDLLLYSVFYYLMSDLIEKCPHEIPLFLTHTGFVLQENKKIPPDFFDILVKLVQPSANVDLAKVDDFNTQIISAILLILQSQIKIPIEKVNAISNTMINAFNNLSPEPLKFLVNIYPRYPTSDLGVYFKKIPMLLFHKTRTGKNIFKHYGCRMNQSISIPDPDDIRCVNSMKPTTFTEEVKLPEYKPMKTLDPLSSFIPEELNDIKTSLLTLFMNINQTEYADELLESMTEIATKTAPKYETGYIEYIAIILFLMSKMPIHNFPTMLARTPLFDSGTNKENTKEGFTIVHTLRVHAMILYLSSKQIEETNILKQFVCTPELYADVLYSIIDALEVEKEKIMIDHLEKTCETAFRYNSLLKNVFYNDEKITECINIARIATLQLSQYLTNSPHFNQIFLLPNSQSTHFINLLFEEPIAKIIVEQVEKIFLADNIVIDSDIMKNFIASFQPLLKNTGLIISILNMLTRVVTKHQNFSKKMRELYGKAILSLHEAKTIEEGLNLLEAANALLIALDDSDPNYGANKAVVYNEAKSIYDWIKKSIEDTKEEKDKDLLCDTIFQSLIKVITNSNDYHDENEEIDFYNPSLIPIILESFVTTRKHPGYTLFLQKQCQVSGHNCVACNKCSADVVALSIIESCRIDPHIDIKEEKPNPISNFISEESIDALFKFYETIAVRASSYSSVLRFVELFSPICNAYLPAHFGKALSVLERICQNTDKQPSLAFPYTPYSAISITNLDSAFLCVTGFSTVIWLLPMGRTTASPCRLMLIDFDDLFLQFDLESTNMKVTVSPKDEELRENTQITSMNLKINEWNLVRINIKPEQISNASDNESTLNHAKFNISITCNNEKEDPDKILKFEFYYHNADKSPLSIIFAENKPNEDFYLGYMGIFFLDTPTSIFLEQGLKNMAKMKASVMFQINPCLSNDGKFDIGENNYKNVQFTKFIADTIYDLPGILASHGDIQALLPLLAQSNLIYQNKTKDETIFNRALEIIIKSLGLSTLGQNGFVKADGFASLSHLLRMFPEYATVNTYKIFCSLLNQGNDTWKKMVISYILTDTELWMRTKEVGLRMLKSLHEDLTHPVNKLVMAKVYKYWFYFGIIDRYLSYNQNDESTWSEEEKDIGREYVFKTMLALSTVEMFSRSNIELLAYYIITSNNIKQKIQYLDFTYRLLRENKEEISKNPDIVEPLFIIRILIGMKDENLIINVLKVLSVMASRKITTFDCFEIIIREMDYIPSIPIFDALIEVCQSKKGREIITIPEMLPVCCWSAININEPQCYEKLLNLKADKSFANDRLTWAVWPIIMLKYLSDEDKKRWATFLVSCSSLEWSKIMNTIMTINFQNEAYCRETQKLILSVISENYDLLCTDEQSKNAFDELVIKFLCFKIIGYHEKDKKPSLSPQIMNICKEYYPPKPESLDAKQRTKESGRKIPRRHSSALLRSMSQQFNLDLPVQETDIKPIINHEELEESMKNTASFEFAAFLTLDLKLTPIAESEKTIIVWNDYEFAQSIMRHTGHQRLINMLCSQYEHYNNKNITESLLMRRDNLDQMEKINNENVANISEELEALYKQLVIGKWPNIASQFSNFVNAIIGVDNILNEAENLIQPEKLIPENTFVSINANTSSGFQRVIDERKMLSKKSWFKQWKKLTVVRAPWHLSLPVSQRKVYFKRACTLCNNHPALMVRNFKFDSHIIASKTRETGDIKKARAAVEIEEENKKKSLQKASSLLKIETVKEEEITFISSEKFNYCYPCEILTVSNCNVSDSQDQSSLTSLFMFNKTKIAIQKAGKLRKSYRFENVEQIALRTMAHRKSAIEVFLKNGESFFINFSEESNNYKDEKAFEILAKLKSFTKQPIQDADFLPYFNKMKITEQWLAGRLSNFQYLLEINKYSGRSFNNPSQYPLFPWILKDYTSNTINMDDETIYRDFRKPVGAFTQKKLDSVVSKLDDWDPTLGEKHLYGAGPVSPMTVFHYLIRVEPFTKKHIGLQSNRFDATNRQFSSIPNAFALVSDVGPDFRELLPEFFYFYNFLVNENNFDLGKKEGGVDIGTVELPPWANNDPFRFIYLHRKALESRYVSENINNWIDLMFGAKQNDMDSFNVYCDYMYQDVWEKEPYKSYDEESIKAIVTSLKNVGQIPQRIFAAPHPVRNLSFIRDELSKHMFKTVKDILPTNAVIASSVLSFDHEKLTLAQVFSEDIAKVFTVRYTSLLDDATSVQSPTSKEGTFKKCSVNRNEMIITSNSIYATNRYGMYVVGSSKREVFFVDKQCYIQNIIVSCSEIKCIDASDNYLIIGDSDGVATVYRASDFELLFTIHSFMASLTCIFIQESSHVFACGTGDGFLLICSLNSQSIIRTIDLGSDIPLSLLITPSWSFVIVRMHGKTSCYLLNGFDKPVWTLDKEFGPSWAAIKTHDDFDYIISGSNAGDKPSISVFEAYDPKPERIETQIPSGTEIVELQYSYEIKSIVVHTSNRGVYFIPYHVL